MAGLKKARLNKGNTNTLFDAYSEEEFEYDLAGNPYRYRVGSSAWNTVSSNKNNQTTQIDYASDAVLPIRGKAPADATLNISVDGVLQNYTRPSGQENFAFGLNAYTSTRKYHEVNAEAVETDNNTTPPTTIRTMQRGKAYVEATPESFTYDANGNLLSDGRWNYTWDAENRLVEVETNLSAASAGVPQEKYVYVYDWTGRKIKAERYEYEDNAWMLVSTNKRYYDDYNLIYETTEYADGSSSDVRKYYYGSDLLGSVYGSAGTGGLRMMSINGEDLFVFNNQVGSVEALFGADTDTAAQARAEYIYSSYGEVMMKSGDLAEKNNITYSTRYKEANTGLVSYAYRHYSPRLKKWLSKDPIAEQGGINLYQMVANMPINSWDILGYVAYMNAPIPQDYSNYNSFELGVMGFNNWLGDIKQNIIFSIEEVLKDVKDWKTWLSEHESQAIDIVCKNSSSLYKYNSEKGFYTKRLKYILGGITLKVSTDIKYNKIDCSWNLSSTIIANDDIYDFHPGNRGILAETLTRIAWIYKNIADSLSDNPLPSNYVIPITGVKVLNRKGNCKK